MDFEKAPLFILSIYIVEFGYSGQIWPSGRYPLCRGLTVVMPLEGSENWKIHKIEGLWSLYIVEFGYSGQIWPPGRVPLYRGLTVDR